MGMKPTGRSYLACVVAIGGALVVSGCASTAEADVRNEPAATLSGRVVDTSGQFVGHCNIIPGGNYTNEMQTVSAPDGSFTVSLPDGYYDIEANCRDYDETFQLAGDLRVAVGTAARAYRELEEARLVETRRSQGTLVRHNQIEGFDLDRAIAELVKTIPRDRVTLTDVLNSVEAAWQVVNGV